MATGKDIVKWITQFNLLDVKLSCDLEDLVFEGPEIELEGIVDEEGSPVKEYVDFLLDLTSGEMHTRKWRSDYNECE